MARIYLDERESGAVKRRVYLDTPSPFQIETPSVPEVKTPLSKKIKNFFTEDASKTVFDTFYQKKIDERNLKTINNYSDAIKTLIDRNKVEADEETKQRRDKQIEQLFKQQQEIAGQTGGEIAKKSNAQLAGQALGTALDLTPILGFGGFGAKIAMKTTQMGARALTKTGMESIIKDTFVDKTGRFLAKDFAGTLTKTSMVEGGLFGVMAGTASEMQKEDATFGSTVKSAVIGGAFGVAIGGVLSRFLQFSGDKISDVISKRAGKVIDEVEEAVGDKVPDEYRKVLEKEVVGGADKETIIKEVKKSKKELDADVLTNTENETVIRDIIKDYVSENDIDIVTKIAKNIDDKNEIIKMLDDYSPEVQKTRLIEELSFADTDAKVAKLLKGKVPNEQMPALAKALAGIEKEATIAKILDNFDVKMFPDETPTIKTTPEAQKATVEPPKVADEVNVPKKETPVVEAKVEPILEEAKKYKSAEEFVKAQGTPVNENLIEYLQRDLFKNNRASKQRTIDSIIKSVVKKFNGQTNPFLGGKVEITESALKKAIYDDKASLFIKQNESKSPEVQNSLIDDFASYYGIEKQPLLDQIKTKQQLKDIWNKAQKTKKTTKKPTPKETPKEKPKETPKTPPKETPKETPKPKQTTFQDTKKPQRNIELIETTEKVKSRSGQKLLKKVIGDIEEDIKDMPEFGGMNMADQAEKALTLALNDYDYAFKIAMGLENPPKGIKTGSIFNAVKRIAIEKGDIDTIIELATSPEMNSFKKALGQEVKAFDDTMTDDPTKVIEGIIKAQKEQITNADSIIKAEEKKITDLINKKQTTPENFINDILC